MLPRLLAPTRPDWRWARVVELAQLSNSQAAARLRDEDRIVQRGYAFKRALDRGTPDDYDVEHAAHYIFLSCPRQRYLIEGMLLGGESDDQAISSFAGQYDARIVGVYHDLFFAVRPFLKSAGWIADAVFDGMPYKVHPGDGKGLAMRLAWLLGAQLFQMIVRGSVPATSRGAFGDVISGILQPNLLEAVLTVSYRHESADWIKAFSDHLRGEDASGSGSGNDMSEAVGKFLEGLGISVADPTEKSNLELPAREPRALPCEVIPHA